MGSSSTDAMAFDGEKPQHRLTLPDYWIGKTEVTNAQFRPFVEGDGYSNRAYWTEAGWQWREQNGIVQPGYWGDSMFNGDNQPVVGVSWFEAVAYCRWLSAQTGREFRLPSEAEWEYAARAGTKTPWSFGADGSKSGEYAWSTENSDAKPHPVGKKKPNPWGLHDIHGNVAEWCIDQYAPARYQTLNIRQIALGPVLIPGENRYPHVVRGGSWDDGMERLRSAARLGSDSGWSLRDPQDPQSIWWHTEATMVGFRIVRPLSEQEDLKDFRSKVTRQSPN